MATAAAATKIQALARGNQGRKTFEADVLKMIEDMMAAQEPKHTEKPRSSRGFAMALASITVDEDDDVEDTDNEVDVNVSMNVDPDDGVTEEEIITLVIEDSEYTDHTREELVTELVTYRDIPPPPPPKTGFALYNDQLKASQHSTGKPKQESTTPSMNKSGHSTNSSSLNSSSHHVRTVAAGWWSAGGKTSSEKTMAIADSVTAVASLQSATPSSKETEDTSASVADAPVANPKASSLASKGNTATAISLPAAIPKAATQEKIPKATTTEEEAAESTIPPITPISKDTKQKVKTASSPSALGFWASKEKSAESASLPAAMLNLDTPEETAEFTMAATPPTTKKPKAVAASSPKALGFWASKDKQATDEPAPAAPPFQSSTRRWKKQKTVAEPVPATTKEESNTTTDTDESAPVATILDSSAPSAGLGSNSSHHNNKFAVPWLKAMTSKTSEREPSPPPPEIPRYKGSLVDRYLSVAKKENESEHERRMAQIEADRARGRWDGTKYVHGENENESEHKSQKNWKYLQQKLPQSPQEQLEDGAAIKLQALVRGFMARRQVAKYVDSLIEELMRKMNDDKNKEKAERHRKEEEEERRRQEEEEALSKLSKIQRAEALRKKEEGEERRRQEEEEEEARRRREAEERRRKEKEERRLRGYNDRDGLPLWWMELVPHNNLDQKAYKALIKVDNGATIIDYKMATHGFEKRNAEPLEAITEADERDDENDANLDKILGNSQPTKKPAGPKPTNEQSKSSMFSCMCVDAIEGVEYTTDPNAVLGMYKNDSDIGADDKEDTESSERMVDRVLDLEPQESAPPEAANIVVPHDMISDVKVVLDWRERRKQ